MRKLLLVGLLVFVFIIIPTVVLGDDMNIIDESGSETLEEGWGVYTSPHFYGVYAGWSGTAPLMIINGKDMERTFSISLEEPNGLEPKYKALPKEYYSWIVISDNVVTAKAGETIKVPVTITIPGDIVYTKRHDQIAFQVAEVTDEYVKIALQSYWFMTTDSYLKGLGSVPPIIIVLGIVGGSCGVYLLARQKRRKAESYAR